MNNDLISRQAAIDLVESFYKIDKSVLNLIDKSVLNLIVFELKQLPSAQPEPCEDAVSREAAVNAIKKEIEMNNEVLRSSTITYETRERISQRNGQAREDIAAIEVLPSVTPKPKTGKWHHYEGMYTCDQCGSSLDDISPFCPMCGSDMRGDASE